MPLSSVSESTLPSPFSIDVRHKGAASCQNQQNDLCAQQGLRSAWASTQSDQSSQCAQWVAKVPMFLHGDREDSDQTGWMPKLIWVFAGRTDHFVGFVMRQLKYVNNWNDFWFQTFSENELNSFEYKSLQDAMSEIKESLDPNNIKWVIFSISRTSLWWPGLGWWLGWVKLQTGDWRN